ncbi:MAG: nuclear transport factor 2 family protein [Burkholderiaceae bacterium]
MADDARLAQLRRFFETISPESVGDIGRVYAPDAFFKDPFNEVRGLPAIEKIFRHMFEQVGEPRFVIHDAVIQGEQGFVTWDFRFRMRRFNRDQQMIRGASHLRFAPDGRIVYHRDYWDAAEELYEKLPALGPLLRLLKRRVAH